MTSCENANSPVQRSERHRLSPLEKGIALIANREGDGTGQRAGRASDAKCREPG
jgi:hypothetical protein